MMNLGDLNISEVQRIRPSLERSPSHLSYAASRETLRHDEGVSDGYDSEAASDQTVTRWDSPPRNHHISRSGEGQQLDPHLNIIPQTNRPYVIPELARLLPAMRRVSEVRPISHLRPRTEYDSPPTPNLDDTPYIRYALDQLTRQDERDSQQPSMGVSEASYPVERMIPDQELGYVQSIKRIPKPTVVDIPAIWRNEQPKALSERASSERKSTSSLVKPEMYIPVAPPQDSPRYPDLTYKPMILRPVSMITILILCLSMITALIFCAVYSSKNHGLTNFTDSTDYGLYFVFRFLPQLLAAIILLYVQSVMAGLTRIMPYAMMASENGTVRESAIYTHLYPRHWLPRIDLIRSGETTIGVSTLLIWPLLFSIPLQSALFSVVPYFGVFRWATVEGVAWTLVVVYIMVAIGLLTIFVNLSRRITGLIWDPKSLADIISLLPKANNLNDFQDTEVLANLQELREALPERNDRLGYWHSSLPSTGPELFHSIGEEGTSIRRYTLESGKVVPSLHKSSWERFNRQQPEPISPIGGRAIPHQNTNSSLLAKVYSPEIRFRFIPRCLSEANLIFYPTAFFIIYLLILIFSFLPSTAITHGFRPLVIFTPVSGAFSPSNFLYSFLPSFIGMLLYLSMLSLSTQLAILAPWAEMNTACTTGSGASPERSILVDYAYTMSTPFATLLPAIQNKHRIIATLSVVAPLTLLVPILFGGCFFSYTALPSDTLLVFPNLGAYYTALVLLGLLFVFFVYLPIHMLKRATRLAHRLPHGVSTLAEIFTFLYSSHLLTDATFANIRGESDLRTRLLTSSGTMSTGEKRLTGDGRNSEFSQAVEQQAQPATETVTGERKDGRGIWDPTKWGGVGGWVRNPGQASTPQPRAAHLRAESISDARPYAPEASDFSSWDKEMGISHLGGVIAGGDGRRDDHEARAPPRNRKEATAHLAGRTLGERPGKRYFLGIFRGRDGRSHFGIERVGREEGRGPRGNAGAAFGGPLLDPTGRNRIGAEEASRSRFSL